MTWLFLIDMITLIPFKLTSFNWIELFTDDVYHCWHDDWFELEWCLIWCFNDSHGWYWHWLTWLNWLTVDSSQFKLTLIDMIDMMMFWWHWLKWTWTWNLIQMIELNVNVDCFWMMFQWWYDLTWIDCEGWNDWFEWWLRELHFEMMYRVSRPRWEWMTWRWKWNWIEKWLTRNGDSTEKRETIRNGLYFYSWEVGLVRVWGLVFK